VIPTTSGYCRVQLTDTGTAGSGVSPKVQTVLYWSELERVTYFQRLQYCALFHIIQFLPAALREAQAAAVFNLLMQRPILRFFAPQGRHVGPMGVKFGTEEGTFGPTERSPPPCQISPPSVQRLGYRTPKLKFLLRFHQTGAFSFTRFS